MAILVETADFRFFTQTFGKHNWSNIRFSIKMKFFNLKGILTWKLSFNMLSVSKHIVENGMHNNMNNRVTLSLVLCQYLRFLISISKITTSTSFLVTPYTREFLIYWYRYDINAKFIFLLLSLSSVVQL